MHSVCYAFLCPVLCVLYICKPYAFVIHSSKPLPHPLIGTTLLLSFKEKRGWKSGTLPEKGFELWGAHSYAISCAHLYFVASFESLDQYIFIRNHTVLSLV